MIFYLISVKGSKKGQPIAIDRDLCLVGSDRMCQLRKDGLGKRHCAFVVRDKKVFVRDMDCGQSTIVNGAAIPAGAEWPLHAGDRVEVGPLEFMIQFREKGLLQRDLEEWAMRCLDGQVERPHEDDERLGGDTIASAAAQSIINLLNSKKGLVKGRLRIGHESGIITVRFNDEMLVAESEIALIKQELCENLNKPNARVLLDLKTIRKMSTAAVLMLGEVYRWLRPSGTTMAACRVRPEVQAAMGLLDLENIPIFESKKAALTAKW